MEKPNEIAASNRKWMVTIKGKLAIAVVGIAAVAVAVAYGVYHWNQEKPIPNNSTSTGPNFVGGQQGAANSGVMQNSSINTGNNSATGH